MSLSWMLLLCIWRYSANLFTILNNENKHYWMQWHWLVGELSKAQRNGEKVRRTIILLGFIRGSKYLPYKQGWIKGVYLRFRTCTLHRNIIKCRTCHRSLIHSPAEFYTGYFSRGRGCSYVRKHAQSRGSGGMPPLPMKFFLIYNLWDCFWWLLRPHTQFHVYYTIIVIILL